MRIVPILSVLVALVLLPDRAARAEPDGRGAPAAQQAFVEPLRQVVLVAPLTARVDAVAVDVGDRVESGQEVVRLEARVLELAVKQMELEAAAQRLVLDVLSVRQKLQEAAVAAIATDLERIRALVESSVATSEDVADAEAALAQARAELDVLALERRRERLELEQRELALEAARLDLERASIRAPFDGVVAALQVSPGDTVRAMESPVVTVLDPDRIGIVAEVPAAQADLWKAGKSVRVTVPFDGTDHVFPARVERVAPTVDVERQRVSVRLALAEPPPVRLRPGLAATAELLSGDR